MSLPNIDGSNKDDTAFMNMEVISGIYQFNVQYSKTKDICKVKGDNYCITSPIFKVNGHDCQILYFPPGSKDTIVLTLAMHCKSEKVTVSFTLALLDKYGRPSYNACKSKKNISFDPDFWVEHGIPDFMERSLSQISWHPRFHGIPDFWVELEGHFVRDGCFTLVCSITILDKFYKEVPKRFGVLF